MLTMPYALPPPRALCNKPALDLYLWGHFPGRKNQPSGHAGSLSCHIPYTCHCLPIVSPLTMPVSEHLCFLLKAGSTQLSSLMLRIPPDPSLFVRVDTFWRIIIFRDIMPSQSMEESGNLATWVPSLLCHIHAGWSWLSRFPPHVWMWELDYKESWAPKNWWFWTAVLEKTLESPLDCKEIQPIHPKGD